MDLYCFTKVAKAKTTEPCLSRERCCDKTSNTRGNTTDTWRQLMLELMQRAMYSNSAAPGQTSCVLTTTSASTTDQQPQERCGLLSAGAFEAPMGAWVSKQLCT